MNSTNLSPSAAVDARCLARPGIGFYLVTKSILEELSSDGWGLTLVVDSAQLARDLAGAYPHAEVAYLPKTTWLVWEQVQLAGWLHRRRPDVWVAPTNWGVPLMRPRSTKSLLVVHDLVPVVFWRTYLASRPLWAAMYLSSTAAALASADLVVAVSEHTAADVHRFSRRRAVVAHSPVPKVVQDRPPRPLSQPYVLFNGGFDSRKNVPNLLAAFRQFRQAPEGSGAYLVVMGDRPELARSLLVGHGLADVSVVTGYVSEEDKWAWLANALCVAYPSSYEGFGLVVAEAFAAGVPIVCGTGGSLAEVAGGAAIFVDPTCPSSIADGLRAACDPAVRRRLAHKGYAQLERLRGRSGGWARLARQLVEQR